MNRSHIEPVSDVSPHPRGKVFEDVVGDIRIVKPDFMLNRVKQFNPIGKEPDRPVVRILSRFITEGIYHSSIYKRFGGISCI